VALASPSALSTSRTFESSNTGFTPVLATDGAAAVADGVKTGRFTGGDAAAPAEAARPAAAGTLPRLGTMRCAGAAGIRGAAGVA
jgi:hypothetical protein